MLKKSFLMQKRIEYSDMNDEELFDLLEDANTGIRCSEVLGLPNSTTEFFVLRSLINSEMDSRKEATDESEDY